MRRINFFSIPILLAAALGLAISCSGGKKLPPVSGADAELNRCLKLSTQKNYQQAVECLEVYKSRYPAGTGAANADLLIADNYFRQKEYLVAAETYQEFLKTYPGHSKADYAYYKSGLSYLKESPKAIDRDQEYLQSAVQNFEMIVRYFPASPYRDLANQEYKAARLKQARKNFYVGHFYFKYGEYIASIPRFGEILSHFPGLGLDEESFYYLITASARTNQKDNARKALDAFEQRYPKSPWVKKAKAQLK